MPKRVLFIDSQEIHQIGGYVSVCFNTKERKTQEGNRIIIDKVRDGKPYIDFPWIREDSRSGEFYLRDDSTVVGGLRIDGAKQVAQELQQAIRYIEIQDY